MDVCLRQCGVAWGISARLTAVPNTFDMLWIRVPIYLGFVWAKTHGYTITSDEVYAHTDFLGQDGDLTDFELQMVSGGGRGYNGGC